MHPLPSHSPRTAFSLLMIAVLAFIPLDVSATIFEEVLGWREDVDPVVAPSREFMVIPEQAIDGSMARIRIMDLDASSGAPLGVTFSYDIPGLERGVDPLIVPDLGPGSTVLAPVESPDGLNSGLLVLLVDAAGLVGYSELIELDDLGFMPDVDGIHDFYAGPAIAFFPLESPGGDVRGILAVDADARPNFGDVGVGSCTLLSTDGRLLGDTNIQVDWLTGLAPGVDPLAFEIPNCCTRLALPVASPVGADLLLVDFDPNVPSPPLFLIERSVREINADTTRPTDFPGYEWDVDLRLFEFGCGGGGTNSMLVPVESDEGEGDIYYLDEDGNSLWVLSNDGAAGGFSFDGFEKGVDLLPVCNGGGSHPHRLLVPTENPLGTDADLLYVDMTSGEVFAQVEDVNAGLSIEGYEVGVDPLPWFDDRVLLPVEDAFGIGRLLAFDGSGVLVDEIGIDEDGQARGFPRSVDPVIAQYSGPIDRILHVPVENANESGKTDVLSFPGDGLAGGASLEEINDPLGLVIGAFRRDLDPMIVENWLPGLGWIWLPESTADGDQARIRFELVPQTAVQPVLVLATDESDETVPQLQFFDAAYGTLLAGFDDPLGMVDGLDLGSGRGAFGSANQPYDLVEPGYDADSDPTDVESTVSSAGDYPDHAPAELLALWSHANPLVAPATLRLSLAGRTHIRVDIVDVAGRRVRRLFVGEGGDGELPLIWDGLDEHGRRAGSGVYFATVTGNGQRRSSKFVLLR